MINRVCLTGRLTKDPNLRQTNSGLSVASFTLAIDRQWVNNQGSRDADFINCVIWRKAAENFCNFTGKGSLVGIDGRLQTRSYEDKDGKRVFVTEVVVDNFSLLESKKERLGQPESPQKPITEANRAKPGNYAQPQPKPAGDPFKSTGNTIDINDDQLPF